ncbi:hypothetical protein ELUMI_v1c06020 [Williamsoniiplasma luminosum]|uniref:Uncharacterized protein n=1 Tax=Williamsoniiplasma luminosum TaxID=214888 RepID=A0A2K8NU80_9MOLU|nr:hypothetical protein [Williamsoniiplasma luminosum]ATZ17324.1 hypothetical protein ELUMI_v1c06020 [Williamsoniiplasma luminosum]
MIDAKKVYKSLVYLSLNIIKNEKLRFEIFDKANFRNDFVAQINNMLTLEKDFDVNMDDVQLAQTFAKAIVKITESKQRFEKNEKTIDEIYAEYSSFLSETIKQFEVGRNELVNETLKITEEDILYSAIMNEAIKSKYKDLEKTQKAEEEKNKQAEEAAKKQQEEPKKNNQNTNQGQGQGFFGGFGGPQYQGQGIGEMPIPPSRDPRFYPYNAKPQWMPITKKVIAIIVVIASIILLINNIYMMTIKITFPEAYWREFLFNKIPPNFNDEAFWKSVLNLKLITDLGAGKVVNIPFDLQGIGFKSVFNFILGILPAIYISFDAFRKPRSIKEKYRMNFFPVMFVVIFLGMSLFPVISVLTEGNIKDLFKNNPFLRAGADGQTLFATGTKLNFDGLWNLLSNDYGHKFSTVSIFSIMSLVFISLSLVAAITILVLNPKLDRQKQMRANAEFQKAMMYMSQGQSYQMDQSLYDNPDEVIIKNPSKFSIWWNKTFKKKKDSDKK